MLTTRMQIQALADRLAGLPVTCKAKDFNEPWKSCWLALENAPAGQANLSLVESLENLPDREAVVEAIFSARPGEPPGEFPSLREMAVDLLPIDWIWPGWIPRSMITLLGAVPGAGKSFLALDLSKRVIQGEPFPDGQKAPKPGANVIYVDAEAVPQLLNERANSWKMVTERLFLMLPEPGGMIDFSLARYRDQLTEMVARLSPELVILDSLSSISSKGENSVEDVRTVLYYLNALAQDFNVGLVLIHHLRKAGVIQGRLIELGIDDFRGSSHIIAMARSVMGLSVVQTTSTLDRNGPRKLEIIKTNLGPYPHPLGFEFAPLQAGGVFLKWGKAPKAYHEPTLLEKCVAWLQDLLSQADAPLKPRDVIELGDGEGYSRALVYHAREALGEAIENTHGRKHPDNCWKWAQRDGQS